MKDYSFKVISPRSGKNKQVDLFFIALANEMGSRAVGIILSGYNGDGTVGCKHIKANGGTTFAQDISAEIDSMPLHAQEAGCVDYVLPLEEIPEILKKLVATLKT
jgi:two-component system CheB/CheR fusion protein